MHSPRSALDLERGDGKGQPPGSGPPWRSGLRRSATGLQTPDSRGALDLGRADGRCDCTGRNKARSALDLERGLRAERPVGDRNPNSNQV